MLLELNQIINFELRFDALAKWLTKWMFFEFKKRNKKQVDNFVTSW